LADATVGVDLLVIEGMGRAIHTNLHAYFKCDCLKLAMIKTERIAKKLFNGRLYDCMCKFQPGLMGSRGGVSGSGGSWSLQGSSGGGIRSMGSWNQ
jgi:type II pantothenate kinase